MNCILIIISFLLYLCVAVPSMRSLTYTVSPSSRDSSPGTFEQRRFSPISTQKIESLDGNNEKGSAIFPSDITSPKSASRRLMKRHPRESIDQYNLRVQHSGGVTFSFDDTDIRSVSQASHSPVRQTRRASFEGGRVPHAFAKISADVLYQSDRIANKVNKLKILSASAY